MSEVKLKSLYYFLALLKKLLFIFLIKCFFYVNTEKIDSIFFPLLNEKMDSKSPYKLLFIFDEQYFRALKF